MTTIIFEAPTGLYASHHGYYPSKDQSLENKNFFDEVELNWDCDTAPGQGPKVPKYIVRDIELPLITTTTEFYIQNYIKIEDFYRYVGHLQNIPINHLKKLWELYQESKPQVFMAATLLNKKTIRSPFIQSLATQLNKWLCNEGSYATPFSWKQVQCFMNNSHIEHEYRSYGSAQVRFGIPVESILI